MKTLTEVKKAVKYLRPKNKTALTLWFNSQFDDQMTETDARGVSLVGPQQLIRREEFPSKVDGF
jgi:hypothetical protein